MATKIRTGTNRFPRNETPTCEALADLYDLIGRFDPLLSSMSMVFQEAVSDRRLVFHTAKCLVGRDMVTLGELSQAIKAYLESTVPKESKKAA